MSTTQDVKFTHYPFHQTILKDVAAAGYENLTPIQAECIPLAMSGKDVIGLAQTGTGKTAAFALPIIHTLAGSIDLGALVLAPTRELARQVAGVFDELGRSSGIRTALLVGGVPTKEDHRALRQWPNVVVATPGRLIDHIDSRTIVLKDVKVLVVDEADRMHDMGFMPQIRRIIEVLPHHRQTLMFTATMPEDVERIARRHMRDAVRVQIGASRPPERAEQHLFYVRPEIKIPLLLDLLDRTEGRVLIFVRTKRGVDRLARGVANRGHRVGRLHSDRTQPQRDAAMADFRNGKCRILIATDIAARGIDVADIEHVINYDFPGCPEDYIHRVGRTARLEASGRATSFVTGSNDRDCLRRLERMIGRQFNVLAAPGHSQTDEAQTQPHLRPQAHGFAHHRSARRTEGGQAHQTEGGQARHGSPQRASGQAGQHGQGRGRGRGYGRPHGERNAQHHGQHHDGRQQAKSA